MWMFPVIHPQPRRTLARSRPASAARPMIAKDFTPGNGAKVFAIMKHPRVFHDREDFYTPQHVKPFAIMKIPPKRSKRPSRGV
jgi:hypothetical protein